MEILEKKPNKSEHFSVFLTKEPFMIILLYRNNDSVATIYVGTLFKLYLQYLYGNTTIFF